MPGHGIRGVLFDLDGTLVDSARETTAILNAMRVERGKTPLPSVVYKQLISHGASALVRRACEIEADAVDAVDALVKAFRSRYLRTPTPPSSLYPGAAESLRNLRKLGLKIGICTNKPESLCRLVLTQTGLDELCDTVVAGGMTNRPKPHRDPLEYALAGLGLSTKDVMMIGDSTVDQKAAAAMDIPFIFFSRGYDDGVDQAKVFAIIERLDRLIPIILKQNEARSS
jgi:phosphoglycolate phosphatase